MLQFLPLEEENVFAVRATGKLNLEDYQQFLPELESRIGETTQVSLLMELDDFHGWTLDAAREDFQFGTRFDEKIARIALVGDKLWQRWMSIMAKPFFGGDIRYFARENISEAWEWLREFNAETRSEDTPMTPYQGMVVAMDFSPHATRACKRALELSKLYQAKITLLHVINEEYLYDILYGPGDIGFAGYDTLKDSGANETALRESAEKRMQTLKDSLDIQDVKHEIVVGTPSHAILSFAAAHQADLIVMGTHGRKGLARLLGSNARSVVTRAQCEVLTVPLSTKPDVESLEAKP